jgi:glutamate synthase (NADPH/NADH) large chain
LFCHHEHLVKTGLRTSAGLVVDTGSAREVHHFALLAGYGAEAVCPWLAFETIKHMDVKDSHEAAKKFVKAIGKGLYKVMSKMGISTYQSYCGAQIFEAIPPSTPLLINTYRHHHQHWACLARWRKKPVAYIGEPVLAKHLDAGGEYAPRAR